MHPNQLSDQQQTPPPNQTVERVYHRNHIRELAAVGMAALALGGALHGGDGAVEAYAKGVSKTAVVPKVSGDTLAEARAEATHAGLKVVGKVNVGKDKRLDPGEKAVASGLEARTSITRRVGGKLVKRSIFKFVRPGRILKRGTQVKTEYRIVPETEPVPEIVPGPPSESNPGTAPGPETPAPAEFDLSRETDKFLRESAVIVPALEFCSGLIVKNSQGKPVAVASAKHCIDQSKMSYDNQGKPTLTVDQPLIVRGGDTESSFQDVGSIDRILVARGLSSSGEDSDLALIAMKGSTDQEVINAYRSNLLNDQMLQNLPSDAVVRTRGYPLNLPNSPNDPRAAQTLEGKIIAKVNINTTQYPKLPTIMVGFQPNANGFVCAPGNSGAVGVITQKGTGPDGSSKLVTFYVGIDSAMDDFRPPPFNVYSQWDPVYANKDIFTERKNQFGFTTELDPYKNGVVCYFNNQLPAQFDTIKLATTVTAVQGLSAAPPPSSRSPKQVIDSSKVISGSR